jgi:hypothetical protein
MTEYRGGGTVVRATTESLKEELYVGGWAELRLWVAIDADIVYAVEGRR